jgi:hypothetical protein
LPRRELVNDEIWLPDVLRRIHRLERILVLELGNHECQEVFLAELGLLGVCRIGGTALGRGFRVGARAHQRGVDYIQIEHGYFP